MQNSIEKSPLLVVAGFLISIFLGCFTVSRETKQRFLVGVSYCKALPYARRA